MKFLKRITLIVLILNISAFILTLIIYKQDINLHYNGFSHANNTGPALMAIGYPIISIFIYLIFSRFKPVVDSSQTKFYGSNVKVYVPITEDNRELIRRRTYEFIWQMNFLLQVTVLLASIIVLVQDNFINGIPFGTIIIILMFGLVVLWCYRVYIASTKLK